MGKMKALVLEVTELYESGMSVRRIAEVTGMQITEVLKSLELMGYSDGPTEDDCAEQF